MKRIDVEIQVPQIPNFISVIIYGVHKSLPINEFTEKELSDLGKLWTDKLIEQSKKRENNKHLC